jgi:hypothetical protein
MTRRLELVVTEEDMPALARALRPLAGEVTRWELDAGEGRREIVGRVARPSEWLSDADPHLLVAPGQTNATNVLAFIAVHLRWREADAFVVRRRSYEEEPLEWERLGRGAISLRVTCLEEP